LWCTHISPLLFPIASCFYNKTNTHLGNTEEERTYVIHQLLVLLHVAVSVCVCLCVCVYAVLDLVELSLQFITALQRTLSLENKVNFSSSSFHAKLNHRIQNSFPCIATQDTYHALSLVTLSTDEPVVTIHHFQGCVLTETVSYVATAIMRSFWYKRVRYVCASILFQQFTHSIKCPSLFFVIIITSSVNIVYTIAVHAVRRSTSLTVHYWQGQV